MRRNRPTTTVGAFSWATTGALILLAWPLYISAISPTQLTAKSWPLARLTCPIALAHHYPISLYVVLLANAATYPLVGVLVETIRRHYQTHSLSN